ncbi:uncharacterized protein [Triticum aestivum]|uniref:uncharacterized protein isoform X1 n=2 Tax=Triticum aestivum TaxID=4565 RepID=UPI001D02D0DB|nr:uncharacterized protein LOC123147515 isoform X1 [Triticum aestivum]
MYTSRGKSGVLIILQEENLVSQKTECKQVHMGNPQSKAAEQTTLSDVPPDQMEGANVDEIYPSSPERRILEQTEQPVLPQPTDGDSTNVQRPSHLITDSPAKCNEPSFVPPSCLTQVCATDVAQSSNVAEDASHIHGGRHVGINASIRDALQVLPVSDATSDYMTTTSGVNVAKQTMKGKLSDEKREQINARRAAYRKKKEDDAVKLHGDIQTSLTMSASMQHNEEKREIINTRRRAAYRKKDDEVTVVREAVVQNVLRAPLGDITNGYQPTSVDLDEKKEQLKARRRATYRKKKEDAAVKHLHENLPALAISDVQNVHRPALGDITNGYKTSSVDLDDKREEIKARRRSTYRKKKDEAAVKHLHENLPALTVSG